MTWNLTFLWLDIMISWPCDV